MRSTALIMLFALAVPAAAQPEEASECRRLLDQAQYAKAVEACLPAAKAGDAAAQFNVSVMYARGWGIDKSEEEELKWLQRSAEQRHAPAQWALASRTAAGRGVPKDAAQARRLAMDAAEQGLVLAQIMVGRWHEAGYAPLAIDKQPGAALAWYRRAAQSCEACHYELWRLYFFGSGVEKDVEQAARHLRTAAQAGLPKAQMQLGFRYRNGEGVPKDAVAAYQWFYLADKGGDPLARKALPLQERELNDAQVREARASAAKTMQERINARQLCAIYEVGCGAAAER
jgi:TPR repeat protein